MAYNHTMEHKFRIWDSSSHVMVYPDDAKNLKYVLAVGLHGLPIVVDRDSFKENEIAGWNVDHNRHLMAWTGLQDDNGTDIYEGDLFKSNMGAVGEVEVDHFGAWLTITVAGGGYMEGEALSMEEFKHGKVVGNVYESEI